MTGIQHLKELHKAQVRARFPNLPEAAVASGAYTDKTANGLTKCIVKYVELCGGWATRVSTTGRLIPSKIEGGFESTRQFTDFDQSDPMVKLFSALGSKQKVEMKFMPGTTKRGTPDIMGVLNGKQLAIEVKIGKDKQSAFQIEVEKQITAGGGFYYLAKDFESTFNWINQTILNQ